LAAVVDMLDELLDLLMFTVDKGPLEGSGKKAGLPVLCTLDRIAPGRHRDEGRQVGILRSQSVGHPRSHAGTTEDGIPAIHEHEGRLVVGQFRLHGADDRNLVHVFRDPWKYAAHLDPTLPMSLELKRRRERGPRLAFGAKLAPGKFSARMSLQGGLGIKRVHVGWPSIEEKVDDPLRRSGKVRLAGRPFRRKHLPKSQGTKTHSATS